jgi:hypothetical protein
MYDFGPKQAAKSFKATQMSKKYRNYFQQADLYHRRVLFGLAVEIQIS